MSAVPVTIAAGELEAVFVPELALVGTSLRRGVAEVLELRDGLAAYRERAATMGIPLLHPWANRLGGFSYRAAGRRVALDRGSPLLKLEEHGLPIHGAVPAALPFAVRGRAPAALDADFDTARDGAVLEVFPYPHRLDVRASVDGRALVLETRLTATGGTPVPVAFGYHPYFRLPGAREAWVLELPAREHLELDESKLPTGRRSAEPAERAPLGARSFDDGYAVPGDEPAFAVSGGGLRVEVRLLAGYRFAQVFTPPGAAFVALEPMTAPADALRTGDGLAIVAPGQTYRAAFAVSVEPAPG